MWGKASSAALLVAVSLAVLFLLPAQAHAASGGHAFPTFTYNPVNYGVQDTITASSSPNPADGANIIVDGNTVASNSNGAATYTFCVGGLTNCLQPGTHTVAGCDLASGLCSSTQLIVNPPTSPSMSVFIQYSVINAGTTSKITSVAEPDLNDGTEIKVDGAVVASNSIGISTYTCGSTSFFSSGPCTQVGNYIIVGCDLVNGVCSQPQTLTIVPAGSNTVECIINRSFDTTFDNCVSYALPIALLAVIFALSLIGLSYMLSEVFNINSLKGWWKSELREAAKSVMIIVVVFAALIILGGIASILAGSPPATGASQINTDIGGNLYNAAYGYLQTESTNAQTAFYFAAGAALGLNFVQSVKVGTWIPIPLVPPVIIASLQFGSTGQLFTSSIMDTTSGAGANLSFLRDALSFIIVPMLMAFDTQLALLQSMIEIGLLVFLPIGLILRAIPFLRGIGGTLIAIGISLSLIYPMVLVGFNAPASNFIAGSTATNTGCLFNTGNGIIDGLLNGVLCSFLFAGGDYAIGAATAVSSINQIYPLFNSVMYYIIPLIFQFMLLVLDIVIVTVTASALASALGGKLRLSLGRFKIT